MLLGNTQVLLRNTGVLLRNTRASSVAIIGVASITTPVLHYECTITALTPDIPKVCNTCSNNDYRTASYSNLFNITTCRLSIPGDDAIFGFTPEIDLVY